MLFDFDEEFASVLDYANAYRRLGLQAVPSVYPTRGTLNWKRPALPNWREYQKELVDQKTFDGFFNGLNVNKTNIGILTGDCSNRVFVIDVDLHKGGDCAMWWSCCIDMQEKAGELETPTQVTGGGGLQMLFRAPADWTPPTIKTSIGVDIRGVGGFAVIAPSMHESGKRYVWEEGLEPWNIEIADAPKWLCEQIDELAERYGGHSPAHVGATKTITPDHMQDGYGHLVDGREDYMSKMIWARVVDLYRDSPIMDSVLSSAECEKLFDVYLTKVDTRLSASGLSKSAALEKEGRGITAFRAKWRSAIKQWDDKVRRHAEEPREKKPHVEIAVADAIREGIAHAEEVENEFNASSDKPEKPSGLMEVLSLSDIMDLPDPVWLVEDLFIEDATSFLYGPPGCGKSFLALDLAIALCCEQVEEWFGRRINRHGPVVYITNEGVASMKFRLRAIEGKYGIPHKSAPFELIRQPINFLNAKHMIALVMTIRHAVEQKYGQPPVAVFIDTVSRVIPGADENLQKDMTTFIASVAAVKHAFSCMAMGVHHQSRNGGSDMRGSTVLDGAGDANLQVEREKGDSIGQVHARKIKDAEDGWTLDFELKKVELGYGKGSLVVEMVSPATTPPGTQNSTSGSSAGSFGGAQETGMEPDMETCKRIVEFIDQERRDGVALSSDKRSKIDGRYAPDVISRKFPVSVEWGERMIRNWLLEGVIRSVVTDPKLKTKGLERARGI